MGKQPLGVLRAGKLTALITITNLWSSLLQCLLWRTLFSRQKKCLCEDTKSPLLVGEKPGGTSASRITTFLGFPVNRASFSICAIVFGSISIKDYKN
jgi:hypothetical protein